MACKEKITDKFFGCEKVIKNYGTKEVLRSVDFLVKPNGIIGIFGLNGSGKTTLLRILSGLDGNFKGLLYKTDFTDVSYMSVENYYPAETSVKELISFFKVFCKNQNSEKIINELNAVGIPLKSRLRSLSSGMRQYVKFLLTVYSGASVCLFDEPLTNLDVNMREKIAQTMIENVDENRLFIITTHEINAIERLIEGFFILHDGKLSPFYSSDEVVEQTGKSINEFYKEKVNEK